MILTQVFKEAAHGKAIRMMKTLTPSGAHLSRGITL